MNNTVIKYFTKFHVHCDLNDLSHHHKVTKSGALPKIMNSIIPTYDNCNYYLIYKLSFIKAVKNVNIMKKSNAISCK